MDALITQHPVVDALFDRYTARFGKHQTAYRNHVYRVMNLVARQMRLSDDDIYALGVAAFFHDAGIWLAGTFDYLQPSTRLALHFLEQEGRSECADLVSDLIMNHHKISRFSRASDSLAEAFRRADWIDVSLGVLRYGVPKSAIVEVRKAFPNAGFHALLMKLGGQQLLSQPWRPFPMLRL